jgi:peptidyl-prolyl cis-trans isomerase NIMA-interacting 1
MRTVLRLLVLLPLAGGCADLTEPSGQQGPERATAAAPGSAPAAAATATAPTPPPAAATAAPSGERISAAHILVAYKGSRRAAPTVTRTKEEARKRAEQLLAKARKGDDFGQLARENSDDPTAKARGGDLGTFDRSTMVKEFADPAFALKPGQVSAVVETDFGFHVIKRTN